ncbi:FkbM family methyltransferase [Myxosarcina sp. GI1(2024)]
MNLQQIPSKFVKKLLNYNFKLLGRDSVSRVKIVSRNDLKKIGTDYGGWVVPVSLIKSNSICYCVGCGEDISFDLGLIDYFDCDVYGFDPTPRAINHVNNVAGQNPKYHFYEIGLWDKQDQLKFFVPKNPVHVSHSLLNLQRTEDFIYVEVKRLKNLMEELGHYKIDLLKIDIEGAEYKVIQSIIEDNIDINVICIEYDECFNPIDRQYKNRIRVSVNSLVTNGYSLVCAQGNGNYTFVKNTVNY